MPATNDSTIVREIKELAKDSAASSEQAAQALSESQHAEDLKQFRDRVLDLEAEAITVYKMSVLEARRAESAAELAALWKETYFFYARTLALWRDLAAFDPASNSLVEHYRQTLSRLKNTAAEHYEFHAPGTQKTEAKTGKPDDPEFEADMALAREIMKNRREALRELAK